VITTEEVREKLDAFVAARNWEAFHSPKNLSVGLCVEASEVAEVFQWLSDQDSYQLDDKRLQRLKEEIGDVQLYLLNLASKFALNPLECAISKLALNERKYPADVVRGSARKYDEY
jgi:NTP pyrophosphatase (non-canonical NTP hydrolase)